jgi:acetyltransferase-like isoleucine patch superfamily enzyme
MALVGAGSVVTEDVSPGDVVVGNPARVVNKVSDLTCPYEVHEGSYGDLYAVYEDKE